MDRRPIIAAVALVVMTSGCVGSARTTSAYQDKAVETASSAVTAARTVLLASEIGDAGQAFATTTAVTVADAETDAASALDAFSSIQPPDASSDAIRQELLPDVQDVLDTIQLVRIAARRADGQLTEVAAPLDGLATQLDAFVGRYG
jgi:hypothetical protein